MTPRTRKRARLDPETDDGSTDAPSTPSAVISIDPDGDLLLRIGTELGAGGARARDFKVCSAALRRASAVWKTMLFGPWAEAKPADGDWIVELPEDDPEPAKILLPIVHGRFGAVLEDMSLDRLYGIVIFADKYDLFQIIQPLANPWVVPLEESRLGYIANGDIKSIHVGWELGREDMVNQEIARFVFNLGCSETGFFHGRNRITFGSHSGPPDLEEIITEHRLAQIQKLLDFYHGEVESRIPPGTACIHPGSDSTLCDSVILGGIWQHLQSNKQEFLPRKATEYSKSTSDLLQSLFTMFNSLPTLNQHKGCSPATKYLQINQSMRQYERSHSFLLPHHQDHMAERQKMTGGRYISVNPWSVC